MLLPDSSMGTWVQGKAATCRLVVAGVLRKQNLVSQGMGRQSHLLATGGVAGRSPAANTLVAQRADWNSLSTAIPSISPAFRPMIRLSSGESATLP